MGRDWLPPTWAYTRTSRSVRALEVGQSNNLGSKFPSLPHISPRPTPRTPSGLACSASACTSIRISNRQTLLSSAVDHTKQASTTTWGAFGVRETTSLYCLYSTTTTHTPTTPTTHQSSPSLYGRLHRLPGLIRCTPLDQASRDLHSALSGSTPTLAPCALLAFVHHENTTVVSSHTEATHWRCTGVGRKLSTCRWADPETIQPHALSRRSLPAARHCHEQSACGNAVLQYQSSRTRETTSRTRHPFARHIVCLFSHQKLHTARLLLHDRGAVSPKHPLTD